jgi:hypothetical protein
MMSAGSGVLAQVRNAALWDMLFFFAVLVVGFLYLWRFGYLDWVWTFGSRITVGEVNTNEGEVDQ